MENRVIINMFQANADIIRSLREYQADWLMCNTRNSNALTQAIIEETQEYGCCYLCLTGSQNITDALVQYAAARNVRIWVWGITSQATADTLIAAGVTGFQNYSLSPFV